MTSKQNTKQNTINEQINLAERVAKLLGGGIKFLAESYYAAEAKAQDTFVILAEKNPQVAEKLIGAYETLSTKVMDTEVALNNIGKEMVLGMTEAVFGTLNQVVAKTDFTALAMKAMELEEAKRQGPLSPHDQVWKLQEENRAEDLRQSAKRLAVREVEAAAELAAVKKNGATKAQPHA